jgi:hypothetical protein
MAHLSLRQGGGLYNEGTSLAVTDSTLSGNCASGSASRDAAGSGGGLFDFGQGTVAVTDSTFGGNSAAGPVSSYGGGIYASPTSGRGRGAGQGLVPEVPHLPAPLPGMIE